MAEQNVTIGDMEKRERAKAAAVPKVKDPMRYVLATYKRNGQESAQNPLPIQVNGERALFHSDEALLCPAYIVDSARKDGITTHEVIEGKDRKEPKTNYFVFEVEELDAEFQTVDGAREYGEANGIRNALVLGKMRK